MLFLQRYMFMPARIKDCYLVYLLRTFLAEPAPAPPALPEQIIVFASTCNAAQLLAETLRLLDVPSAPLHSRIAQNQRNQSLRRFKSRIVRVLVATDVASR
jgi:superfamily II DNA/RNA helicase